MQVLPMRDNRNRNLVANRIIKWAQGLAGTRGGKNQTNTNDGAIGKLAEPKWPKTRAAFANAIKPMCSLAVPVTTVDCVYDILMFEGALLCYFRFSISFNLLLFNLRLFPRGWRYSAVPEVARGPSQARADCGGLEGAQGVPGKRESLDVCGVNGWIDLLIYSVFVIYLVVEFMAFSYSNFISFIS
jgi:hypothetical protein